MATKTSLTKQSPSEDVAFTQWFEMIYDENFERLYRYAYSITKKKDLAEDVVSEVFLNIWNMRPDYNSIRELRSYLHVSVKHLAIRQVSSNPHQYSHSVYDETIQISDVVDPESLLLAKELEELIASVVNGLSDQCRLVYDLSKIKGLGHQEIAEELGISKRTVEAHIYQVFKLIKAALREHFKGSEINYPYLTRLGMLSPMIMSMLARHMLLSIN